MSQCFQKDCREPTVGTVNHPFAPGGSFAYCAKHILWTPPERTGWRCACGQYVCADEGHYCVTMRSTELYERAERAVMALERIASVMELRSTATTGYPPLRKVSAEEWERMSPLARQGAYVA